MGIKLRATGQQQFLDNNGNVLELGKVYTYIVGTSEDKATYTTQAGTVEHTNPIILDAYGRAEIWWDGTYKISLTDKNDNVIPGYPLDNYGVGEEPVVTGTNNLILNGSFEIGATLPDDWQVSVYTGATVAFDTADQYHASRALKFTSTGSGGGDAISEYFEVGEGESVAVDLALKSTVVDIRNVVDITWYDEDKVAISTTNLYDDSTTNPTSWTLKHFGAAAPTTARYAKLRIYGGHSSDTTIGSTWFDHILARTY